MICGTAYVVAVHLIVVVISKSDALNGQSFRWEKQCVVGSHMKLFLCDDFYQNATLDTVHDRRFYNKQEHHRGFPEGISCWTEFTPGSIVRVVCRAGRWTTTGGDLVGGRQENHLLRTRRATFIIHRWENGGPPPTANLPPTITCPKIDQYIYTEKAQATVMVSWDVPAVNNTSNGVISVIQTQGQPPGTQHSAGTYIVSYMARDYKGQAAICSVAFTVVVGKCPYDFTYMLNGTATCTPESYKYINGSQCSYTCTQGYKLTGSPSLQCLSNESWNGSKPQCQAITCGSPKNIEHGYLACETNQYTFMSKCGIFCDMGYAISGQSVITCQASGQWTVSGECQEKRCQELETTDNIMMNCTNNNTYSSVCYMTCPPQYVLQGDATRTCQENEAWSGQPPQCKKICPEPAAVSHGELVCKDGRKQMDTCTLMCDQGYRATGFLNVTCNSNFMWTQAGSCLDIQPPTLVGDYPSDMEVVANQLGKPNNVAYIIPNITDNSGEKVNVVGSPPSGSDFAVGNTTVTITASDTAGNNATFTFVVRVIARLCPNPSRALVSADPVRFTCPNGFVFGAVCNASCADGRQPLGMKSITCHLNSIYSEPEWLNLGDLGPYCQAECSPGQWSSTGQQPCDVCDIGTYQESYNSTICTMCPYLMVTPFYGAVSKSDCKFVTATIGLSFPPPIIQVNVGTPEGFTAMIWVRVNENSPRMTLTFTLNPLNVPQGSGALKMDDFSVYVVPTNNLVAKSIRYWYHVVFVFTNQDGRRLGKLFVNGEVKEAIPDLAPVILNATNIDITFTGTSYYFISSPLRVSAFQMSQSALTDAEVRDFYRSCQRQVDNNIFGSSTSFKGARLTVCDDVDDCVGDPCGQHATCFDIGDTFRCECKDLWSGDTCQISPNFCVNNTCAVGATCINQVDYGNFTCMCPDGYKGPLCKDKIVNGGWGEWGAWSSCSAVCGSGQRSRKRVCDSPKPDTLGANCDGDESQEQYCFGDHCPVDGAYGVWSDWSPCSATCGGGSTIRRRVCDSPAPTNGGASCDDIPTSSIPCNAVRCPECSNLVQRSGHQRLDCKTDPDNSMTTCQIICKPGLIIMPQVMNMFQCGIMTNYTWTHQTDRNPTGILPECAKPTQPRNTTIVITYVFDAATSSNAQPASNVTNNIEQNFLNALNCNNSNCNYKVTATTNCSGQNPVTGTLRVEIIQTTSTTSGVEGLSVLDTSQKLDGVVNNVINMSADIFKGCVDGPDYSGHVETAKLVLLCPDGAAYSDSVCVECPPGSYSAGNGSCIWCEENTYQDKSGMTFCNRCDNCSRTLGEGSFTVGQCEQFYSCTNVVASDNNSLALIIGLVAGLGAALILTMFVAIFIQRKCRNRGLQHPYDIPGPGGLKDEDPYADADKMEIYDEIEENPYISAQGVSSGSNELDSNGCRVEKGGYSNQSYAELMDPSLGNDTDGQFWDDCDIQVMENGSEDFMANPDRKLSDQGIVANHADVQLLYSESDNAPNASHDLAHDGDADRAHLTYGHSELGAEGDDHVKYDNSRDLTLVKSQTLNVDTDDAQTTVDVTDYSENDKNADTMKSGSSKSANTENVPRKPPLPHRSVRERIQAVTENTNNNGDVKNGYITSL